MTKLGKELEFVTWINIDGTTAESGKDNSACDKVNFEMLQLTDNLYVAKNNCLQYIVKLKPELPVYTKSEINLELLEKISKLTKRFNVNHWSKDEMDIVEKFQDHIIKLKYK